MKIAWAACAFALAPLCWGGLAHANPWPKEDGQIETIGNATIYRQESGLTGGATTAWSDFHLEYGATSRITLLADSSFQQYMAGNQRVAAFDTAWLGARATLIGWDNSVLSAEIHGGTSGIRENSSIGSPLPLNGTAEARLMYGQGFEALNRHAFAGAEFGWRWRGGAPADEFVFDTIAGIAPWASALLMLQSFSIAGVGSARGVYRRYDLTKLQLSLAQRVTQRWWVQGGIIAAVAGADSGEAGALVALWSRF